MRQPVSCSACHTMGYCSHTEQSIVITDMSATLPPSQIRRYQDWLKTHYGLTFENYDALWRWSVTDLEAFWRSIWQFDQIESPTPFECALGADRMPGAVWFKGATVNYARQVLRHVEAAAARGQPAIVSENELGETREMSWRELKRQVASFALTLRELGVERGDRVAAYLTNCPEAVVAFLACSSVGAVWSVCAPDMGTQAVTDRFVQIQPKILIAVENVFYAGKRMDRRVVVQQLQNALPSLRATIVLESAAAQKLSTGPTFAEAISHDSAAVAAFEPEWLPSIIRYGCCTRAVPPDCPSPSCKARAGFCSRPWPAASMGISGQIRKFRCNFVL
jgi:acetoacetyl-CoA synthetase